MLGTTFKNDPYFQRMRQLQDFDNIYNKIYNPYSLKVTQCRDY